MAIELRDAFLFLLYGLCVAVNFASYFYAFKWISGTLSVVLLYTYPILVVIISAFVFREKITANKIVALILTFVGLLLVIQINNIAFIKLNFVGICCGLI